MRVELTLRVANPDVVVLMYEGAKTPLGVGADTGKALAELAAKEVFAGKDKELVLLYPCGGEPGRRVFLTGLGARRKCTAETVRQRIAAVVRRAREAKSTALDVLLPGPGSGGRGSGTVGYGSGNRRSFTPDELQVR